VVFDTFARLHPNKPGNGIGLPAVAQMVRAHGGEVGIRDTDTGQGSEFWFTIPDPTTEQSAIPDS
ncbi:MAG TPA: ATP-binding protein, partial [Marmoricola sp.]|nr:ATP-binding protein [Marmoricola sp.]